MCVICTNTDGNIYETFSVSLALRINLNVVCFQHELV